MLILALVTGLMAVARYFGGEVVHKLDQTGVLLGSAVLATIGIYLFSTQTGTMAYAAAIIYANCSRTVKICPVVLVTKQDSRAQRVLTPIWPTPASDPREIQMNKLAQSEWTLVVVPS
jgi:hypothetical protein